MNETLLHYQRTYFSDSNGLCALCGNSGIVDTRGRAVTGAGVHVGRRMYCLCANGQTMRQQDPQGPPSKESFEEFRIRFNAMTPTQRAEMVFPPARPLSAEHKAEIRRLIDETIRDMGWTVMKDGCTVEPDPDVAKTVD